MIVSGSHSCLRHTSTTYPGDADPLREWIRDHCWALLLPSAVRVGSTPWTVIQKDPTLDSYGLTKALRWKRVYLYSFDRYNHTVKQSQASNRGTMMNREIHQVPD